MAALAGEMEPRFGRVVVLLGGGGVVDAYYNHPKAAPYRKLYESIGGSKEKLARRLAIADPNGVPAGRYGKGALETLGVWSTVANRLAPAENVRAALALVARGETPLGIVYQTDAASEKAVKIVGTFPQDTHPPIIYPIAVVAGSPNPAALGYLAYLKSRVARPTFEKHGFTVFQ